MENLKRVLEYYYDKRKVCNIMKFLGIIMDQVGTMLDDDFVAGRVSAGIALGYTEGGLMLVRRQKLNTVKGKSSKRLESMIDNGIRIVRSIERVTGDPTFLDNDLPNVLEMSIRDMGLKLKQSVACPTDMGMDQFIEQEYQIARESIEDLDYTLQKIFRTMSINQSEFFTKLSDDLMYQRQFI